LGEFYTTNGSGDIALLAAHGDWDRGWDMIVPGQFGGDGRTDLLFYDREGKLGSFWATNGSGGIVALGDHGGWRDSWRTIVPGYFNVDGWTDLFFYER
jgi:hypothetical protein